LALEPILVVEIEWVGAVSASGARLVRLLYLIRKMSKKLKWLRMA
jgi:hypothetical protein